MIRVSTTNRSRIVLLAVVGAVAFWGSWTTMRPKRPTRTLRFLIEVQNQTNRALKQPGVEILSPLTSDFTRLDRFQVSVPYRFRSDDTGTKSAVLDLGTLGPFGARTVEVTADIGVVGNHRSESTSRERYLRPERYIESESAAIRKVAGELHGRGDSALARSAFDWITRAIAATPRENHDRGALYALERKRGDCSELAFLYSAVLRAKGIPARPIAGVVTDSSRVVTPRDYHGWVEVYLDGRWRIVDPHGKSFLENEDRFIPLRIVSQDGLKLERSQSFFAEPEGTRVTLK